MDNLDKTKRGNKKRRTAAVLVVALLVAMTVWNASLRVGVESSVGVGFFGQEPVSTVTQATFRVGTFNIAGGKGHDGQRDVARTAAALEPIQPDLVALQEVRGQTRFAEGNQARTLGERLGLGWLYAPAESRWFYTQFGNAVLGSMPVRHWQRIPLPRKYDRSYRNVVFLIAEFNGRPIRVLATHVTQRDPRDREEQLRAVIELFLALQEPAILLGDLNSRPDSRVMKDLLAHPGVDDPLGRLLDPPPEARVDWILTRGLNCVDAGMVDEGASDHPLYWAEMELREATPTD